MTRFQLTPEANADLKSISKYLVDEASVERSIKIIGELRNECRKLAGMPGMGHYREDLLPKDYRFWTLYRYVIAYRWKCKPIQIIAFVHGARDLNAFFEGRMS